MKSHRLLGWTPFALMAKKFSLSPKPSTLKPKAQEVAGFGAEASRGFGGCSRRVPGLIG